MKNIRIITPSYLIKTRKDHLAGIRFLTSQGFNILNPEFPLQLPTPQQKAEQLIDAFGDPTVDIILAQRGGYSAIKTLPWVDFERIGKNPKFLAGFSDLSALLNPIYERTGLTTLHAPMVINLGDPTPFTKRSFLNALNGYPERNLFKGAPLRVYHPGQASGVLKGGNLITLTSLISTPWEITTRDAILFLEDVDEKEHEIDRYLTQWILAGKFSGIRGLILGDFRGVPNKKVYEVLASQMSLDFPVVYTPYIGHVKNKITLPVGAQVDFNTQTRSLRINRINLPGVTG